MAISLILVFQFGVIIVLCVLGGYVLWQRGRTRPAQLLALMCVLSACWVGTLAAESLLVGRQGIRFLTLLSNLHLQKIAVSFAMAAFIGFAWSFPVPAPSIKRRHVWGLSLLALVMAATVFTPWASRNISQGGDHIRVEHGPLHHFFVWYVVLCGLYALGFLIHRHLKSSSPLARAQIAWVTVGIGISYLLAVVFSLLLPFLFGIYDYQQVGTLAPAIGFILVAYAIVKYRVMEIRVVISRSLTWLLISLLLLLVNFGLAALLGEWIREMTTWELALAGTVLFYPLLLLTRTVRPTFSRLLQREYHAMGEAVDGLMSEAGELTDLRTLSQFIISRTGGVLSIPRVTLLLCDHNLGRCELIRREGVSEAELTPQDPFLTWLAENVVTLEVEQVEQRQRHEAVRSQARDYFGLVGARACLTLVQGGKLVGTLNIGEREGKRKQLTKRELGLLVRFRAAITLALENARMHETELGLREKQVQAEFLARELQEAHEMQEALLPRAAPEVAGLEAAGDCRPAHDVGGDFYDYLVTGESEVSVVLGDVSGKGLRSAMHAVLSSGLLRTRVRAGGSPGAVLSEVNLDLYDLTERNIFTAISFAAIDGRRRRMALINAGLPYPLLRRGGEVRPIELGGLPLGVLAQVERRTVETGLQPDDLLVFHSDGITEASDRSGEMYGEERLQTLLAGVPPGTSASAVHRQIWEEVEGYVGEAEPFDDMTLVVIRIV